jgi:hypothetical protein
MTVTYGFYDSLSGDRTYNALQFSKLFKGIITDGIFQSIGSAFVVGAPGLMTVSVASGRGWFNDRWIDNDASILLNVDASEPVLHRIDTVVVEINSDIGVRANTIKIVKGTPASSPSAPTMANTATLHQYPLANIAVNAGVSSITSGNITNRIGVGGGTPLITGVLSSLDTTTLMTQQLAYFNAWFENLQDQLDDNQAGNLQNQIDAIINATPSAAITTLKAWINDLQIVAVPLGAGIVSAGATLSTPGNNPAVIFADGALQIVDFSLPVPRGWGGKTFIVDYWITAGSSSGNVALTGEIRSIETGSPLGNALGGVGGIKAASANVAKYSDVVSDTSILVEGESLAIRFYRNATAVEDTLSSSLYLNGFALRRV